MDFERFALRSGIIREIRNFFWERSYLEADTPALSPTLIPEKCLEVFRTEQIAPGSGNTTALYLVPSPEVYLKPLIARFRCNVFQVSKCYRNVESTGPIHNSEFTMLEYYTMGADYKASISITESLFARIAASGFSCPPLPFTRLSMDEAFRRYAGFSLDAAQTPAALAEAARTLGLTDTPSHPFRRWSWSDLYELIFVHVVEPALSDLEGAVVLMDYPAQVNCLAKDVPTTDGSPAKTKERWELYVKGMELANCYSEETDPGKVRSYFAREESAKKAGAIVPHGIDGNYWRIFETFPACSGVALGVDRLVALFCGASSIEGVLP